MHSAKAAIILTLLALIASPTLAHSLKQKPARGSRQQRHNHTPALEQPNRRSTRAAMGGRLQRVSLEQAPEVRQAMERDE